MSTKIDLHCHTIASDGSLTPMELIKRAEEREIEYLAITDHDTTAAHHQLKKVSNQTKVKILSGVEISAQFHQQEVHLVGLGIEVENKLLQSLLKSNRTTRTKRAGKIMTKLKKSGLADLQETLDEIVKGDVICRSHLAQLLCETGTVKNFQKAFKKYLGKKGKAWVSVEWPSMIEVISVIKSAGGQAVLAHPTKYKLSTARLGLLIQEFTKAGGAAIEIAYPGLNPSDRAILKRQTEVNKLCVSQGSDFHHPGTRWTDLGAFGVNSENFETVWQKYDLLKTCH